MCYLKFATLHELSHGKMKKMKKEKLKIFRKVTKGNLSNNACVCVDITDSLMSVNFIVMNP